MKATIAVLAMACVVILATSTISCKSNKPSKDQSHEAAVPGRWTHDRLNRWKAQTPWLVGANFIPSTAINQVEMWSKETFDAETIDRELGFAADLGFNCMRVYLHDLMWEYDRDGLIERMKHYLEISDEHGILTLFVFFDDCWQADPQFGTQPDPYPGRHNSYWLESPGLPRLQSYEQDSLLRQDLKAYVQGVLSVFKDDQRIVGWDLYNEPGGWWRRPDNTRGQINELCMPLLKDVFSWSREVDPSQPLTAGIYRLWFTDDVLVQFQLENSDIISFHHYEFPEDLEKRLNWLKTLADGRPFLCTEYMARPNSTFETDLPILKENGVGAINWGLVSGKTQTIYPWASWDDESPRPEPEQWFHDILRQDGTPFSEDEVLFIKAMTKEKQMYSDF